MPWVLFTADQVRPHLANRETQIYQRANVEDFEENSVDPDEDTAALLEIVSQVCNRFRFEIAANPNGVTMGAVGTLPSGLILSAAIIARHELLSLPPIVDGYTDPRQEAYKNAVETLKSLRKLPKSAFEDPVEEPPRCGAYGGEPLMHW